MWNAKSKRSLERAGSSPVALSLKVLLWLGYVSKGVVYFAIGALSLRTAFGLGGRTADQSKVFETILDQPFGEIMLAALAFGLVGYALWRGAQALFDLEAEGRGLRASVKRVAYGLSALAYLAFAYTAARLIDGPPQLDLLSVRGWTSRLLEQPLGPWLVAAAGLAMVGAGAFQLRHGLTATFCHGLDMARMSTAQRRLCLGLGRAGHLARGVVFGLIGLFLLLAGLRSDPREARGIGETLGVLLEQPFGPWLLGTVAAGFMLYGLYSGLEASYHRVPQRTRHRSEPDHAPR